MPVTPPFLRGQLYSTNLFERCPEFHQCKRCLMCNHYNPHNALCTACEAGKAGEKKCGCTDHQQAALVQFEQQFGRPMFDPNQKAGTVTVGETALDPQKQALLDRLQARELT
jgi:hypothetical protein